MKIHEFKRIFVINSNELDRVGDEIKINLDSVDNRPNVNYLLYVIMKYRW